MNNYTISSDIRRALTGRGFFISMFGVVIVIALSSLQTIFGVSQSSQPLQNGFHAQFIFDALASDTMTLALPILCALPYTAAFIDDIKSGYIKLYLHRSGEKQYLKGKLAACSLSGGLALLIGILISYGLSTLVFSPMELALTKEQTAQPYFAKLLLISVTLFCSGAFWSLVGFTSAAMTQSRYMAYASPFILYYVLIILHERYFKDIYMFYPKEWLFPTDWVLGGFGVILLLIELSAVVSLVFVMAAKRRLANV